MSRLIDVDAMIKKMTKELESEMFDKGTVAMTNCFIKILNEQPTANIDKDVREEAYNKGMNDVWKFVRKTNTARSPQECFRLLDFFGVANYRDIYVEYTPQEALAKLEAYEKEQEKVRQKIMVGDIVTLEDGTKGVVMDEDGVDNVVIFTENGCIEAWMNKKYITKTGKHIDIQSLLEQIKE